MTSPDPKPRLSDQASYSDLFVRLLDAVFLVDPESRIVRDANDACEKLVGLPVDAIVGRDISTFVELASREDFIRNFRVARRRYYPRESGGKWVVSDGHEIEVSVASCMLGLQDGTEVIQLVVRDITKEKDNERKVEQYIQQLEALSVTDSLTGLFNVRHFRTQLLVEHSRAFRGKCSYAVLFLDADNFKHYNDRNGHAAGDELLKSLADIFKKTVRQTDVACRYGGEEFVVICPDTDEAGAVRLAERLRERMASTKFPNGEHQPLGSVTVSMGIAVYPEDGATPESIVEGADQGVYASKRAGRDRMTLYRTVKGASKKAG